MHLMLDYVMSKHYAILYHIHFYGFLLLTFLGMVYQKKMANMKKTITTKTNQIRNEIEKIRLSYDQNLKFTINILFNLKENRQI